MSQKQSNGRKFGRNAKRSPSMAQYRNSNRMAANKRRKIAKAERQRERDARKTMKTPRGTARAMRRAVTKPEGK